MAFIGIDLHTNCFNCCSLSREGIRERRTYQVSYEGFEKFLRTVSTEDYLILEASTGSFAFVDRVKEHVKKIIVVNPRDMKLISFVKKKTDKIDAEIQELQHRLANDEITYNEVIQWTYGFRAGLRGKKYDADEEGEQ